MCSLLTKSFTFQTMPGSVGESRVQLMDRGCGFVAESLFKIHCGVPTSISWIFSGYLGKIGEDSLDSKLQHDQYA